MSVITQAGENIQGLAAGALCVKDAAGGEDRQLMARGEFLLRPDDALLSAKVLSLQFHVDAVVPENSN